MQEYLAFVDEIGTSNDGKYTYRLDFTTDTNIVWGESFNIRPASLVPDLQVDTNCVSKTAKFTSEERLITAKTNSCFSMQDCIDGILPLCFPDINHVGDKNIIILRFGDTLESIFEQLENNGYLVTDITELEHGDTSEIDDVIENGFNDDEE